eukprot:534692_1
MGDGTLGAPVNLLAGGTLDGRGVALREHVGEVGGVVGLLELGGVDVSVVGHAKGGQGVLQLQLGGALHVDLEFQAAVGLLDGGAVNALVVALELGEELVEVLGLDQAGSHHDQEEGHDVEDEGASHRDWGLSVEKEKVFSNKVQKL